MSAECSIARELEGGCAVLRVVGTFDRGAAWALRDRAASEAGRDLVLDFSLVREFSDLAVAVLAHGLEASAKRIRFRGLRQHQLRIFRYCGVAVDDGPPTANLP